MRDYEYAGGCIRGPFRTLLEPAFGDTSFAALRQTTITRNGPRLRRARAVGIRDRLGGWGRRCQRGPYRRIGTQRDGTRMNIM
jgi:hypothetical protein